MRIRDPLTEGEEPYNLVPLTDMVFNLLIFFMCATTFVQVEKEMSLHLPKAGSAAAMPASPVAEPIIINIKQNGNTVISGKVYDSVALAQRIGEAVARKKDQMVIIRADEEGRVKSFADVIRICTQAGVKEAKLVYLDSKGSGK